MFFYCKFVKHSLTQGFGTTNFALISFYRRAAFYMTSRKIADLKVGDLGDVTENCMECHLLLKRQFGCRSSRRQVARIFTAVSIWLQDQGGGGGGSFARIWGRKSHSQNPLLREDTKLEDSATANISAEFSASARQSSAVIVNTKFSLPLLRKEELLSSEPVRVKSGLVRSQKHATRMSAVRRH